MSQHLDANPSRADLSVLTDGRNLPENTDLNTLINTTSVLLYGVYINAPTVTSIAGLMTVNRCSDDGNWIVQTVTQHDGNKIWVRTKKGTWTDWKELALNSNKAKKPIVMDLTGTTTSSGALLIPTVVANGTFLSAWGADSAYFIFRRDGSYFMVRDAILNVVADTEITIKIAYIPA